MTIDLLNLPSLGTVDTELKTQPEDVTFDLNAVSIGADSQASSEISVYGWSTIWAYLRTLANTWSGTNTFTGPVVVSGGISGAVGAFYEAGGTDVAIADGGTSASTAAGARTALGLEIGTDVQAYDAVLSGTTASFTTADETKLDGIETAATADQTGAEIKALYEAESDTNAFDDAAVAKLAAIEALADVTDATNVTAAGALMDSEVTNLSGIKTLTVPDSTTITAFAATLLDDADAATARATLGVAVGGDMTASTYDPATIEEQLVGLTASQTLTNKTLTSPVINTPALGADSVDAITEIAAAIKSGADATLVTGTAAASGNLAAWNADGDIVDGGVKREVLTAARTYYVRTDGSDSNTGLVDSAGGAFLTIQKAIDVALTIDPAGYAVTIDVGNGTYNSGASTNISLATPLFGGGLLTIVGDTTTPANVVLTSSASYTVLVQAGARLLLQGVQLETSGSGNLAESRNYSRVELNHCRFGASTFGVIGANGSLTMSGSVAILGGGTGFVAATSHGVVEIAAGVTVTLVGTPAFGFTFAYASTALLLAVSVTFSGAATGSRYIVNANGAIETGGAGATYLPGNSAGAETVGGVYA